MKCPFPGMDPYLEAQGRWPGFHNALITHCNEALNRDLPEGYVAQIDERIALVSFVEVRETWIGIYQLPELELVTVVEILPAANESGSGRHDYPAKRDAPLDQPVNLVQIELLLASSRVPIEDPLLAGNYYVLMVRAENRPYGDVYAWTIRDALPRLPVPLRAPEPDIQLDLAEAFALTYDRGCYERIMRYGVALPANLPIAPHDRAWAESLRGLH